jgi:hypothetical protein
MDDRQRDLNRRIRRAQRQELLRKIWEARMIGVIALMLVGALVVTTMYNSSQPQLDKTVLAHLVNDSGVITTRQGTQYRHETVAFESGGTTIIDIPGSDPVPENAAIKVEIYRKDWGPIHQVTYKFGGYDEAAKAS